VPVVLIAVSRAFPGCAIRVRSPPLGSAPLPPSMNSPPQQRMGASHPGASSVPAGIPGSMRLAPLDSATPPGAQQVLQCQAGLRCPWGWEQVGSWALACLEAETRAQQEWQLQLRLQRL